MQSSRQLLTDDATTNFGRVDFHDGFPHVGSAQAAKGEEATVIGQHLMDHLVVHLEDHVGAADQSAVGNSVLNAGTDEVHFDAIGNANWWWVEDAQKMKCKRGGDVNYLRSEAQVTTSPEKCDEF